MSTQTRQRAASSTKRVFGPHSAVALWPRPRRGRLAIALLAILLSFRLLPACAQDVEETLGEEARPKDRVVGEAGYAWQGEADIDGGGSVQVNRFDVGLLGRADLAERLRWTNTYFLSLNDYDFDGGGFSAGDPWGTVLTMRLASRLGYRLNERWGVFGGGVFIFSGENGANWSDSFSGGGLAGVDFRQSEKLFVSLGVAVLSQIEDDARVVPQVVVNWLPHERWAFRVGAVPASGGAAAAAEAAWRVTEPLELGLGAHFNERRFRLDQSGPAPQGVGEDNVMPVRLRVGWDVMRQLSLHVFGGVALTGEVRLEDSSGRKLRDEDYDPAPYVGLRILAGI